MPRILVLLLSLVLLVPSAVRAQVVWDAPSMIRPGAPDGLTVVLVEPHPGSEFGAMALWRGASAPAGLGLRAGIAEAPDGELAALFGVDVSETLATLEGAWNPSVIWWTGGGLGVGDEVVVSIPLGLVFGWSGSGDGLTFMPYAGGHVVLDVFTGEGDSLDLDAAVDLGVDLGFPSGFMARFGATVGGRDALAIGVRFPT